MRNVLFILLLCCNIIVAQKNGKITYTAYFAKSKATPELRKQDLMTYQELLDEEMMAKMLTFHLDFNENESLFYLASNSISEDENQETKKYVIGLFYGFDQMYINKTRDELVEQMYYTSGTLLKVRKASLIDWQLTSESKMISGYKCYKATYTYVQKWKGREFPWEVVAWYTPEIPLQYGPIRYSGLPGLILEISEDNRGFVVDEIVFTDEEVTIDMPTEGEVMTEEELERRHQREKFQLKF